MFAISCREALSLSCSSGPQLAQVRGQILSELLLPQQINCFRPNPKHEADAFEKGTFRRGLGDANRAQLSGELRWPFKI